MARAFVTHAEVGSSSPPGDALIRSAVEMGSLAISELKNEGQRSGVALTTLHSCVPAGHGK